jgi:hypothetical protein
MVMFLPWKNISNKKAGAQAPGLALAALDGPALDEAEEQPEGGGSWSAQIKHNRARS